MNIANNLERSALFFPDRPAISEGESEISYRALNARANHVATGLIKLGVRPGELVGICAPNSSDWIAFYFGVLKAGAVALTLANSLQRDELALLLAHSRPRFLLTADQKLGVIEKLRDQVGLEKIICTSGDISLELLVESGTDTFRAVDRHRNDTAAILYTGGTTGVPKGVMLTHENITVSSYNVAYAEDSSEIDRALCFLPLNHVFGQIHITNSTIFSCGCIELLPAYDLDRVLDKTASGRVTKLFAVPTIYTRLLTVPGLKERLGKVRYCFSAAASMAAEVVRQWKDLTGLTMYESYGMTESASAVTYNHFYSHVIGSVGTSVPGVEVQIRDEQGNILPEGQEGEICIRGRNIMKGYLNNPIDTKSAFWSDGWFRSGDIGVLDERDYLFIVDRLKDMIITGGENVYPREVEEVIYTSPGIQECAVVGLPDREWGERVTAFVVPRPGEEVVPEELKVFLKQRLAAYKIPKEYVLVDEMPKSATGKILKRELKKLGSDEIQ
ncbi:MAG: AMP-binding protein [Desulfomonile tiedjei]|uniref:AMP-binding protein n=1 Tax=Desulfomonile tiedjei TaxID=2358 RepID=A0A9D6V5I8_9BACT|nr:AMP-binding protein [Desulfomonile tiedjei]